MGGKNYEWTQGVPRDEFDKGMALVLGSGPALSLSAGFAF
jgi:hypothetical protein